MIGVLLAAALAASDFRPLDPENTLVIETTRGRVVAGQGAVQALAVGEPPKVPDLMLKVRVAADLPPAERPAVRVLDERGPAFAARLEALKREKGASFSVCDVTLPTLD
ncbi:hypothetical protein [Phenylobacterium sp.]|uniref:hypothetical protein n=1 Tax=Phenylobacterium sp. TaxID=1871053 RepID=UPI003918FE18